jgi:hypothetical protein
MKTSAPSPDTGCAHCPNDGATCWDGDGEPMCSECAASHSPGVMRPRRGDGLSESTTLVSGRNGPHWEGGTHYAIERGDYGGGPYRLNVDFGGLLTAFETVVFAGGRVQLRDTDGETKTSLKQTRLPTSVREWLHDLSTDSREV